MKAFVCYGCGVPCLLSTDDLDPGLEPIVCPFRYSVVEWEKVV